MEADINNRRSWRGVDNVVGDGHVVDPMVSGVSARPISQAHIIKLQYMFPFLRIAVQLRFIRRDYQSDQPILKLIVRLHEDIVHYAVIPTHLVFLAFFRFSFDMQTGIFVLLDRGIPTL